MTERKTADTPSFAIALSKTPELRMSGLAYTGIRDAPWVWSFEREITSPPTLFPTAHAALAFIRHFGNDAEWHVEDFGLVDEKRITTLTPEIDDGVEKSDDRNYAVKLQQSVSDIGVVFDPSFVSECDYDPRTGTVRYAFDGDPGNALHFNSADARWLEKHIRETDSERMSEAAVKQAELIIEIVVPWDGIRRYDGPALGVKIEDESRKDEESPAGKPVNPEDL